VRTRSCLVSLALALSFGAASATAQQRQITGRVTAATTGEAIVGASVAVVGTAIVAATGNDGRFTVAAPEGDVTLVVRRIGFKRKSVPVPAEQSSVEVALELDVFNLEAVVVTGLATGVEQRNVANAVSTVGAAQLTRAPTPTIESALQGKIPGALVQMNSGAPGGGGQITLRGVSTIIGSVDPLIVLDGIVISNLAINNNANAITESRVGGNPSPQDNPVNRIADLNPADIDRIEVLKGASAAAIYGSKASNGVVIITTQRGRVGAPRFHLTQRLGTYALAHKLGFRKWRDSTEAVTGIWADSALIGQLCPASSGCPFFDHEQELFGRHDLSEETFASLTGGTEQTTYYVSGLVKDEAGIAINTGYQKQALRLNMDQRVSDRISAALGANLIHSLSRRGLSNNDNTNVSPYIALAFTPTFFDLRSSGGAFPQNVFNSGTSNPLQTLTLMDNTEDVWRYLGTANVAWNAVTTSRNRLRFNAIGASDFFQQRNDFYSPPELWFEPLDGLPGTVVLGKSENRNLNLSGNVVFTHSPEGEAYRATTSAGVQFEERKLNVLLLTGRGLLAGQRNIDLAASQTSEQTIEHTRDLGAYAQEELLLLNERLLLTVGARADRSSNNGDPDKFFFYPKAAASYRLVQPIRGVDELKLRAAWGQTGNLPLFGAKFTTDTTSTIEGRVGRIVSKVVGDPSIKPERQTEIEAGFDATLANGRATLNVTAFQKNVKDLLLERTLPPSVGFETQIFNAGRLRNRGIEIGAGWTPIQTAQASVILRGTFFANRTKITELPVPTFQTLGFGTALGTFQIEQGKSATQIVGSVGKDGAGNAIEGVVGDANPDFQVSFSSDIQYREWSLGMLWDWKQGGDIINLTTFLFDAGRNAVDFVPDGQARRTAFRTNGLTRTYVQDGSYLKLREVTLAYELPEAATRRLFGSKIQRARVSVSGRNLLRFTGYLGADPEVSNFGDQQIGRNIDVAAFPPWRSVFFSIDLDF